jgi:hypothetical protein
MRRNEKLLILVMCVGVGVVGCGSPPTGDVELAKATVDKAVAAGAANFAPDPLESARKAYAELEAELKNQEGKWFKSYSRASDLAVTVQAAADKAAADAATAKERTLADATATTSGGDRFGPNLFQNGDFSEGLRGWSLHPEADATPSIVASGPGEHAWHVQYRTGNWSVISQELSLKPDTVYVYEAIVKSTAPIVALYWQSEIGRFYEIDKSYPESTRLRYVLLTPHWNGEPMRTSFNPVLMKGAGEASIRDLRLSEFKTR